MHIILCISNITAFTLNQRFPSGYYNLHSIKSAGAQRDASAAAVMACAMYELSMYNPEKAALYKKWADTIVESLSKNYRAQLDGDRGFLLCTAQVHTTLRTCLWFMQTITSWKLCSRKLNWRKKVRLFCKRGESIGMRRIIALLVMICFVAGTFAKVPVTGNKIRLTDNWEFLRQDVGAIFGNCPAVRRKN